MKNIRIERQDEGMLAEQYAQPAFLPPLWRIIFQEAMRGHHLLFPREILESMQAVGEFDRVATDVPEALEEFCVQLFSAPDLDSIRTMIHFLPIDEQKQLFVIYVQFMKSIREANKRELN